MIKRSTSKNSIEDHDCFRMKLYLILIFQIVVLITFGLALHDHANEFCF